MTHEAVSTSTPTFHGARGTSGRAPVEEAATLDEKRQRQKLGEALKAFADTIQARDARWDEAARVAVSAAYDRGFEEGQEALRKQLPAVVRETSFISDKDGRIVAKTEREFKPGGKS